MSNEVFASLLADATNAATWEALKEALRGGGVLPVVGAGLSRQIEFPLWKQFLVDCAPPLRVPNDPQSRTYRKYVEDLCDAYEYEEAAEVVAARLGPVPFNNRLRHTFGDTALTNERKNRLPDAAVWLLPRISQQLITTNFDGVLEYVYGKQAGGDNPNAFPGSVITGPQAAIARIRLDARAPFLLKLHGTWETPDQRVLTRQEFADAYGPNAPDTIALGFNVPALLTQLVNRRPLLFLGCSLQQDSLTRTLLAIMEATGETHSRHFAIMPSISPWDFPADVTPTQEDLEALQWERRNTLEQHGILSICYPIPQVPTRQDRVDANLYLKAILQQIAAFSGASSGGGGGGPPVQSLPPLPSGCPQPVAPLMCNRDWQLMEVGQMLASFSSVWAAILPGHREDCHGSFYQRIRWGEEDGPLYQRLKNAFQAVDASMVREEQVPELLSRNQVVDAARIQIAFQQIKVQLFQKLWMGIQHSELDASGREIYKRLRSNPGPEDVVWLLKNYSARVTVLLCSLHYEDLQSDRKARQRVELLVKLLGFLWEIQTPLDRLPDNERPQLLVLFQLLSGREEIDPQFLKMLEKTYASYPENDPEFRHACRILKQLSRISHRDLQGWSAWWLRNYRPYFKGADERASLLVKHCFPQGDVADEKLWPRMSRIEKMLAECHDPACQPVWCPEEDTNNNAAEPR